MPTLNSTPGDPAANSYLTVVEANDYFASRLFTDTWNNADDDVHAAALMWATRLIDALFQWTGSATTDTQALCWPRTGMLTRNGRPLVVTVVPQDLKSATAEFAGQLIAEDRTEDNDALKQGIATIKVGPIDVGFKDASSGSVELRNTDIIRQWPTLAYASTTVPDAVRQLLVPSWYTRSLLTQPIIFSANR